MNQDQNKTDQFEISDEEFFRRLEAFPDITSPDQYTNDFGNHFVLLRQEYADQGFAQVWLHGDTLGYARRMAIGWLEDEMKNKGDIDLMDIVKTSLFPNIQGFMVKDKPVTLVIDKVVEGGVGRDGKEKFMMHFVGQSKTAYLNTGNARALVTEWGSKTEGWHGKAVELYAEFGRWGGKDTWGLRMRPAKAQPKRGKRTEVQTTLYPDIMPNRVDVLGEEYAAEDYDMEAGIDEEMAQS